MIVIMVSKYFLTCQIVVSSTVSTKFFHICSFAFSILLRYSFSFSFQFSLSSSLPVLVCRFRSLFVSLRSSVSSSFHHLLLKRLILFLGVVSSIAFVMASVISLASRSTFLAVASSGWKLSILGRYSSIFSFRSFQSIFMRLYDGLVLLCGVFGCRFSIVSIGR